MKKLLLLVSMLAATMGVLAQGMTWQTATLISSGETKTGTLDSYENAVWYKIVVPEEGQIEFQGFAEDVNFYAYNCTVNGYKDGDIYDRGHFTGNLLPGPGSKSDTITFKASDVGVGTYYIKLSSYPSTGPGTYRLHYKFTPCSLANDPEPNNDYEHSSLLESGSTVEGRLGYRTSDDVTDIEDWYKIVVPEEGQIELMATATGTVRFYPYYSTVNGYKNNGIYSRGSFTGNTSSASQTDTMTFKATDVGPGTYYIRINRYNSTGGGGYKLYYKFTPCPIANDAEPNEDYEHAAWLPSGLTMKGRLGYRTSDDVTDTQDWYRFTVTKKGSIDFTATGTENLKFGTCTVYGLRDNGSTYTVGNFSGSGTNTGTYHADDIEKGTYYVKIIRNSGSGGYYLTYNGPTKTGDVDGSGHLSIADVTSLINYLLTDDATGIDLESANCNGDEYVTIGDVTDLINILLTY